MVTINPYINFNGNALEAFTFYQSIFGGEFTNITYFKDISDSGFTTSENDVNKIMNIALQIHKSHILMGNDILESMGRINENENRSRIIISTETKEEADKIYNGLSEGGEIEMPISETPWGSYFGMFRDKFGIQWMVDYDKKYTQSNS